MKTLRLTLEEQLALEEMTARQRLTWLMKKTRVLSTVNQWMKKLADIDWKKSGRRSSWQDEDEGLGSLGQE